MKLSEYIESLQAFLAEHGDMNCFYASDDEGNSYQQVGYAGSILYTDEPEAYRPDTVYCEEDLLTEINYDKAFDIDDAKVFHKICIVN